MPPISSFDRPALSTIATNAFELIPNSVDYSDLAKEISPEEFAARLAELTATNINDTGPNTKVNRFKKTIKDLRAFHESISGGLVASGNNSRLIELYAELSKVLNNVEYWEKSDPNSDRWYDGKEGGEQYQNLCLINSNILTRIGTEYFNEVFYYLHTAAESVFKAEEPTANAAPWFAQSALTAYPNIFTPEGYIGSEEEIKETPGTEEKVSGVELAKIYGERLRRLLKEKITVTLESGKQDKMVFAKALETNPSGKFEALSHAFKELGAEGWLSIDIPDEYKSEAVEHMQGVSLNLRDKLFWAREMTLGINKSLADSLGTQTGIGSMPIVLFGNEEQKQRFLPKMSTGELIGAFALTEPDAGSDVPNMSTKAVRSEDGSHYILNGSKTFITQSSIADVFIVFAKIPGVRKAGGVSAFIVTRDMVGFAEPREEHKLGLHGTSTAQLLFADIKVPVENRIGEEGDGFSVAMGTLNLGRYGLGAAGLGHIQEAFEDSLSYTAERKAFGQPIADFGQVSGRLADQGLTMFMTESVVARLSGEFDTAAKAMQATDFSSKNIVWRQFSLEASISKVLGSAGAKDVAEANILNLGGQGYIEENKAPRLWRDAIINMIYEGTNDIQRNNIARKMVKIFSRMEAVEISQQAIAEELEYIQLHLSDHPLKNAMMQVALAKKVLIKTMQRLAKFQQLSLLLSVGGGQEISKHIANLTIATYTMDSAVQRAMKLFGDYSDKAQLPVLMAQVVADEQTSEIIKASQAIFRVLYQEDADNRHDAFTELNQLSFKPTSFVAESAKRTIASSFIKRGKYNLLGEDLVPSKRTTVLEGRIAVDTPKLVKTTLEPTTDSDQAPEPQWQPSSTSQAVFAMMSGIKPVLNNRTAMAARRSALTGGAKLSGRGLVR